MQGSKAKHVFLAMPFLLNLSILGCRDSGTKVDNLAKHQSTVSVHLVSDPSEDYAKIKLFIKQVDIKAAGAWQTLAKLDREFEVQNLGAREEPLAQKVRLPRGSYERLRIFVDPSRSHVELKNGTTKSLGLPEAYKDGIPVRVAEGPSPDNLSYDLILNLDAGRSIRRTVDHLGVTSLVFAPVASASDRNSMGLIAGRLVDAAGKPLPQVQVMAQNGSAEHGRSLVRTVRTGPDGTYKLDLLPVGRMYYVVAQPQVGSTLYAAQASQGFQLARLDRKKTFDFPPFLPATPAAGPKGSLPARGNDRQFDEVDLLQNLSTGERQGYFIIRATPAVPVGSGRPSYEFPKVPGGRYEVRALRTTLTPEPRLDNLGQHTVEVGGDEAKTAAF